MSKNVIEIKETLCSYRVLVFFLVLISVGNLIAQTNAPSIQTGVTFQFSDTQSSPTDPATIESMTVNGVHFNLFVVPSGYEMTQVGHSGHSHNRIRENGVTLISNSSNAPVWSSFALPTFQDKNLNTYFESAVNGRDICDDFNDVPGTDAQKQSLLYSPAIPANEGGVIAITERNANNCYHIGIYGTPASGGTEQLLGETFVHPDDDEHTYWGPIVAPPDNGSDYWKCGRVLEGNNTIGVALFNLLDIVPAGSLITRVQLTASTYDHGDGKFFIMMKSISSSNRAGCIIINTPLSDDVSTYNNLPAGSTYSVISGPSSGQLSFNPDGTFYYVPENNFTGEVSFTYEVCLPPPNATTCDQATFYICVLPENDDDLIADLYDLDDDNDGIPDTDEIGCTALDNLFDYSSYFVDEEDPDGSSHTENGVTFSFSRSSTATAGVTDANIEYTAFSGISNFWNISQSPALLDDNSTATIELSSLVFASLSIADVDKNSNQIDIVQVNGYNNGSLITLLSSDFTLNSTYVQYNGNNEFEGLASTQSNGNVLINFPELVDKIEVVFSGGDPQGGSQRIGISSIDYCIPQDTDMDGIPDHLDTDSDNDGCPDAIEAAGSFTHYDMTSSGNLADMDEGTVDADGVPTNTGSPQSTSSMVTDDTQSNCIPPVTMDDLSSGNSAGPVTVNPVIDNGNGVDSDIDGTIDLATINLIPSATATGIVTDAYGDVTSFIEPGEGTWSVNPTTGEITFTPVTGFILDPTPIQYNLRDEIGNVSNDALVTIDYVPIANDDESLDNVAGTSVVIDILDNDTGGDQVDPTTVTLDAGSIPGSSCTDTDASGDCIEVTVPGEGVWSVDETTGEVTFTPEPAFRGDPQELDYSVEDEEGNIVSASIEVTYLCSTVQLKALLEGPWISAKTMTTDLNDNHLLPGQDKDLSPNFSVIIKATYTPFGQPYDAMPWDFSGNMGLKFGDASSPLWIGSVAPVPYDGDVVDWIMVTVREDGILPTDNIWQCAGWLKSNGDVTFPEECDCLSVRPSEDYHIMVEHRNHLGVLSPSSVNKLSGTAILEWDFTSSNSYAPVPRKGQKEISTGIWAMYAANGEQEVNTGAINSADQTVWKTDQNDINYLLGDFNLNVIANSEDETIWKNNQNTTSGVSF